MPTMRLRFPGGRYHATPWGHHVNEGQIEWPPSPWRLLRALIACGFNTQHWRNIEELPPVARSLIEKLATVLPSYRLPAACAAHSRHFMPVGVLDKGREKTTLVFDTWADVADESLVVHWPCELADDERELLRRLADCLGYLGRSESWVEAELVGDNDPERMQFNAFAHESGVNPGPGWEQLTLMAALPPSGYGQWRASTLEPKLAELALPTGTKKPPAALLKKRAAVESPYPVNLLDCLTKDTVWWKGHRWNQPPGSQRVVYWRKANSLEVGVPRRAAPRHGKRIRSMLLAIATPSGNRSALPSVTRTLPQAELFHQAVVGRVGKGSRVDCPELTGKDAQGRPLALPHQHAHVIPLALGQAIDGHPKLDHILIHAPMGLGDAAQQAIRTLRRTWSKGGAGDLQVAIAAQGSVADWSVFREPLRSGLAAITGPAEGSTVWVSRTPFIPPRFLKPRGKNSLLGQVNAELASRGCPEAVDVVVLENETKTFRHFVTARRLGKPAPPTPFGLALELTLASPGVGPLTLGYGSHFGLGLFEAKS